MIRPLTSLHLRGLCVKTFPPMTTANKITILRILLIPFFVVELIYYVETGNEIHRLVAILSFAIAAILDGVDGYIARHYNQNSELGEILDPLADKLLLVSGIVAVEFQPRAASRPDSALAHRHHHRARLLDTDRHGGHPSHCRQSRRAPAHHRQMRHRVANGRRHLDFAEMGSGFESALAGIFDWRARRFAPAFPGCLYVWDGVKQLGSHPTSSPNQKP